MSDFDYKKLAASWPSPIIARTEVPTFTGGLLSSKYLANLDSLGLGPPSSRCGRKIFYPVEGLVQWMESRSK